MHVPSFIERKRDGQEHREEEIRAFVEGYTNGDIPDYQASAWAMAVYFRGLTPAETHALTLGMMRSGSVFSYPPGTPPKVDKHSTGGIGDKVSLILAPLLACDELWVPMISGRGLGITGGTLDKLESIPGFDVNLSEQQTLAQLSRIGVAMIGQTPSICPADRKLYALRDVTATVPSRPLIVASIMSKKLAESLDRLVLDVKWGTGAFMKTESDAAALASELTEVGSAMGVRVSHRLTPMTEPLGLTAGNALEVAECVDVLQGKGPRDLIELTLDLCASVSNVSRKQLAGWLTDGTAWRKFVSMVEAQGGDPTALKRLTEIHRAPIQHRVTAPAAGVLTKVDAGSIGRACVDLGAGRALASDRIDFAVGCSGIRKIGETVAEGETLLVIHARTDEGVRWAMSHLDAAFAIE